MAALCGHEEHPRLPLLQHSPRRRQRADGRRLQRRQRRPTITAAPATIAHGAPFTIQTPNATSIAEVALIRPGAVTHGWNQTQRFVGCVITGTAAGSVDILTPPDGNVAPPGYYLLFIVDGARVPSVGNWIRVTP